ncbi:MAG: hypothetical protein PHY02_09585 [Phycisphaerae bacterium]|nr:hypothetical protein [Phycisphaerae bacterium]
MTLEILSLTPCILAIMVTTTAGEAPYLQYGALGLCAMIVYFLCKYIYHLSGLLSKDSEKLEQLTEKNTKAYDRLTDVLKDRPCIMKDSRL